MDRPGPEPNAIQNVRNWFRNHEVEFEDGDDRVLMPAIDDLETAYIHGKHTDDLVPVRPKDKSPIRRFLGRSLFLKIRGLRKLFERRPEEWEKVDPTDVPTGDHPSRAGITIWENVKNIDRLAAFFTAFVSLAMLVGPLWILNNVQGINVRLGVITGFLVLFFVLVSAATTARPSEAIAAAAAYSAVLTVFLTLGTSAQTNTP